MSGALQNHTTWTFYLSDTAGDVAVGKVLCPNAASTRFVISTSANRALQTLGSCGIALTAGDANNRAVEAQFVGPVPNSITNLGPGAAGPIRVSTTGTLERAPDAAASDELVGKCDTLGNALVNFATPSDLLNLNGAFFPITVPGTAGHLIVYSPDGRGGTDGGAVPAAGEIATMSNLGAGAGLVYVSKTFGTFNLRSILAGAGVLVTNNLADITIAEQRIQITNSGTGTMSDVPTTSGGVEAKVIVFTGASNVILNSLATPREGRRVLLVARLSEASFTITHNSGGTAANRIHTPNGADFYLADGAVAAVHYDTSAARWLVDEADPTLLGIAGQATDIDGSNIVARADSAFVVQVGGQQLIIASSSALDLAKPIEGDSSLGEPFRMQGATVTFASADHTLAGAEIWSPFLTLAGTTGGARDLVAPNRQYATYNIKNTTADIITLKKSGGAGVAIAAGAKGWFFHNGTDYEAR